MRVLYVGRGFGVHDRRFVTAFAARPPAGPAWDVGVLALDGSPLEDLPTGATAVINDGDREQGGAVAQVRHALTRFRPVVVVAGPIQGAALPAVRAGASPVVAISWAFDLLADARDGTGREAAREALAGSAALLCDAHVVAQAAEALGLPASRITIAPWGVDLHRFAPGGDRSIRDARGWNGNVVVLSTRNHESLYRVDTVLRGFAAAAAEAPELRLAVLGDGSLRHALEERAHAARIDDLTYFAGSVDQGSLPGWYSAADVYVSAAQVDGTSVSLMEAIASGRPAIVSDIPGNREWIEPGSNGWLFPVGDSRSLATALVECTRMSPSERDRMAGAARATAEARADWTMNSERIRQAVAVAAALTPP